MTVSSDRHDSALPPSLSVPSPSSPSAHRSSWACPAGTAPTSCAPRPPCSRQTCSTDPRARKSRTSQDPPETTCSTSPFIHRAGSSRISSLSPRIPVWRAAPLPGQPQQVVAEEGRHPVAAQQGPGPLVIVKATCDTFTHACIHTYMNIIRASIRRQCRTHSDTDTYALAFLPPSFPPSLHSPSNTYRGESSRLAARYLRKCFSLTLTLKPSSSSPTLNSRSPNPRRRLRRVQGPSPASAPSCSAAAQTALAPASASVAVRPLQSLPASSANPHTQTHRQTDTQTDRHTHRQTLRSRAVNLSTDPFHAQTVRQLGCWPVFEARDIRDDARHIRSFIPHDEVVHGKILVPHDVNS